MSAQYSITEPHPTANKFLYSGRGGAGNTFRAPKTSEGRNARGPASLFEAGLPASSSKYSAGRGGAGNIRHVTERPVYSFDEDLDRQSTRDKKMQEGGVCYVGRGGAGNRTTSIKSSARKNSTGSESSDAGARSGFFGRLSNTFERR